MMNVALCALPEIAASTWQTSLGRDRLCTQVRCDNLSLAMMCVALIVW
jgi:hypothetical protein